MHNPRHVAGDRMKLNALMVLVGLTDLVVAHGGHEQQPIPGDADWATRHMAGTTS